MYKKIYLEITNNCNLNCDFCTKNKRKSKFMSKSEFTFILEKIKPYTKYLYFHVLGEPLLHPNINEFIDEASKYYGVNITTNGYLINRIKDNKNIRQLNISLHSYNEKYHISLDDYLENIFTIIETLKEYTFVSLRIWNNSPLTECIVEKINERYKSNIDFKNIKNNTTIAKNIFISIHDHFTWPSDSSIKNEFGTCYALKDHIGILVDGSVIPCCLDADGIINLGNIFVSSLENIINSERYQNLYNNFKNNKKCEELCQRCNFINKKTVEK